jgi:choice-of-anchor A domain-containing protein
MGASQVSLEVAGRFSGVGTAAVNGNLIVSNRNVVTKGSQLLINSSPVSTNGGTVITDEKLSDRSTKLAGDLASLSNKLGSLPATGLCRLVSNIVECKAQVGILNVFEVQDAWFHNPAVTAFNVVHDGPSKAAFVLMNVPGSAGSILWKDKSVGGMEPSRLLLNFISAKSLRFESTFRGGVLAAHAHLQANAVITGSVAVASADFNQGALISLPSLVCPGGETLPPTPVPTTPPTPIPSKPPTTLAPVKSTPSPVKSTPQPAISTPPPAAKAATEMPVKKEPITSPPVAAGTLPPILAPTPPPKAAPTPHPEPDPTPVPTTPPPVAQ